MIRSAAFAFKSDVFSLSRAWLLLAATVLALHAAPAHAEEPGAKPAKSAKAAKAKNKAVKLRLPPDSSESRAERAARLRRECWGGVNAGACEGYTR